MIQENDALHSTKKAVQDISIAAAEAVESISAPIAAVANEDVGKTVREQADRVGRKVKGAYQAAQRSGRELEERAQNSIRQIPITTVLVGTLIGLLFGFILGYSSRRPHSRWRILG